MTSTIADGAVLLSSAAGLSILLKATFFLGLGLMAEWLAKRTRASVRHLLLAGTFAMLLALPFLVLAGPAVSIEIPIAVAYDTVAWERDAMSAGTASRRSNSSIGTKRNRTLDAVTGFIPGVGGMVMAGKDGAAETVPRQTLSAMLSRLISSVLFGIQPLDPMTFASVIVVLGLTAAAATAAPAWHATRIDPAVALRTE